MKKFIKPVAKILLFNLLIIGLGTALAAYGFFTNPAMGAVNAGGAEGSVRDSVNEAADEEVITSPGAPEDEGSTVEKLVSLIPQAIIHALMALGLKSIPDLIFDTSNFINQDTISTIWELYKPLFIIGIFLFAMVLAWLGATFGRTKSSQAKAEASDSFLRWIVGFALLILFIPIVSFMFSINNGIVSLTAEHAELMDSLKVESTGSVLATALVNLYIVGLQLYFNIIYLIREVFIIVLITVSPLVIWTFVVKPARQSFMMLCSELFSNIMMQSAHALAIVILLLLWDNAPDKSIINSWWAQIVIVTLIIPIGQFLRNIINVWLNIFGLQEERLAMGATGGIGAALALPKLISGMSGMAFGAKNSSSGDGGSGGSSGGTNMGQNNPFAMGGLSGDKSSLESMGSSEGSGSSLSGGGSASGGWKWGTAYNVAGKGLAVAGGLTGMTMGLPLGQQRAGMMAGAQAGQRVASNIGQSHHYMTEGFKNEGSSSPSLAKGIGTLAGGASGGYAAGKSEEMIGGGIGKLKGSNNALETGQAEDTTENANNNMPGTWGDYIKNHEAEQQGESMHAFMNNLDAQQYSPNESWQIEDNQAPSLDSQHTWNDRNFNRWPNEEGEGIHEQGK